MGEISVEPDLGRLPFFNADVEENDLPEIVADLRARLGASDGLLIVTVMGANVLPDGLRIPQATRKVTDGRLTDEPTLAALRDLLDDLSRAVAEAREENPLLAP